MTLDEIAKEFNISRDYIRGPVRRKEIPFTYSNKGRGKRPILIEYEVAEKYLAENPYTPRMKFTKDNIIEKIYNERLSSDEYLFVDFIDKVGLKSKFIMKHILCGHEYSTNFSDVYYQSTKCPNCFGTKKYTIDEVSNIVHTFSGGKYKLISNTYINNKSPITIQHEDHTFSTRLNDLLYRGSKCYCENYISKGEYTIMKYFDDNDINYKFDRHNRIDFEGKRLYVDFSVTNINNETIFIEYDGEQHFRSTFFTNDILLETKTNHENDRIKDRYMKSNNFKLYRISYKYKNENLERILDKIINDDIKFNDYPKGEYAKISGIEEHPNLYLIG